MTGSATLTFTVGEDDTALAVGSGSLPVLGTPRLLAWCEAATCAAVEADLAGGRDQRRHPVQLEHLAASPVGARVEVSATTSYADGRLRRFTVSARRPRDRQGGRRRRGHPGRRRRRAVPAPAL